VINGCEKTSKRKREPRHITVEEAKIENDALGKVCCERGVKFLKSFKKPTEKNGELVETKGRRKKKLYCCWGGMRRERGGFCLFFPKRNEGKTRKRTVFTQSGEREGDHSLQRSIRERKPFGKRGKRITPVGIKKKGESKEKKDREPMKEGS